AMLGLAGEVIAIDGKTYLKTTITGPLYQASAALSAPLDPSTAGGVVTNIDALLSKEGVTLTKGDDVTCGSVQCYTVTTTLSPEILGNDASSSLGGLAVDLAGPHPAL